MVRRNAKSAVEPHASAGDSAKPSPDEYHINFDHLARQCQGDAALQRDLLCLFRMQAEATLAQISGGLANPRELADVAHTLRGSALAVGAVHVARSAAALEAAARASGPGGLALGERVAALCGDIRAAAAECERFAWAGRR